MTYDPKEQDDVLAIFTEMLKGPTQDGGRKREGGEKPPWQVDTHEGSFWSHVAKWKKGELVDPDSGKHPMVHAAWRALAIAWQETGGKARVRYEGEDENGLIHVPVDADPRTRKPRPIPFQIYEAGGLEVGASETPFKHAPCQRCQAEDGNTAGQDPALD